MKPFNEVIKEYRLINNVKVKELLESHDLLDIMQSTYSLLSLSVKSKKLINISSLVSNFITISSDKISAIQCDEKKLKMEYILISLSEIILREYVIKNNARQHLIIPQIEGAIRTTCMQCNLDIKPFEKLLKYKVQSMPVIDKKRIRSNGDSESNCSIYWLEKGRLFELIDILNKKKYIKSKKEMFAFFLPQKAGVLVRCNIDKKYHIAYLLYRLFNENYARVTGNRGYFCYAEMMFRDMDGKPFKSNSLKKISSRICKNKEKYSHICLEVDAIISKIKKD
jgi:hypothetical protein